MLITKSYPQYGFFINVDFIYHGMSVLNNGSHKRA